MSRFSVSGNPFQMWWIGRLFIWLSRWGDRVKECPGVTHLRVIYLLDALPNTSSLFRTSFKMTNIRCTPYQHSTVSPKIIKRDKSEKKKSSVFLRKTLADYECCRLAHRLIIRALSGKQWPFPGRFHSRAQKSLDFQGPSLPLALVIDVARIKIITSSAI